MMFSWKQLSQSHHYNLLINQSEETVDCEPRKGLRSKPYASSVGVASSHFRLWKSTLGAIFLGGCIIAVVYATRKLIRAGEDDARNSVLKQSSYFSPILDAVHVPVEVKKMEATFLETQPRTIFRMDPSPEVDAAWHRVSDLKPIAITKEDVLALGKDPNRAAKWPESFGFGPEAYIGRIDVFHQIHCLDALRREANFDYYYGDKFPGGQNTTDEFHRLHISHCLYLLLQNLMCNANLDVYTHFWTDAHEFAYPDFNVNHKCRSFDTVLQWQNANGVDEEKFFALRRPEEYGPPQKMTRKFKELFGFHSSNIEDYEGSVIA